MSGHYLRTQVPDLYAEAHTIAVFLTDVVGWEMVESSDTGDVFDAVFKSAGEPEVPNGFARYIRISNSYLTHLVLYTYETFVSTAVNTGEVVGSIWGINSTQGQEVVVVADLERVVIVHYPYTGTNVYTGYAGRITPYHRANEHPYPNMVKSSTATAITWYSTDPNNCYMVGPTGAVQSYYAVEPLNTVGLEAGTGSDRDGTDTLAAPVIINVDPDPTKSELVGEPRGVYRISPEISQANTFLKIAGEVYVTSVQSGVHVATGPVGTEVPSLVPTLHPVPDAATRAVYRAANMTAHWDETTIQSVSGTITGWVDKTGNGWDLVPGTTAPLHLTADQNGLDTIDCFNGSGYMNLDVTSGAPMSGTGPGTFYMVLITDLSLIHI